MGLRFLCLDGGLPPEFCGFGSLKVNSKVPPIVRVCGGTAAGVVSRCDRYAFPTCVGVNRQCGTRSRLLRIAASEHRHPPWKRL